MNIYDKMLKNIKNICAEYEARLEISYSDDFYCVLHIEDALDNAPIIVEKISKELALLDIQFEQTYDVYHHDGSLSWNGFGIPVFKVS